MIIELNILTSVVMYQLYQYRFSWFSKKENCLVPHFNKAVTPKTLQGVLSSMTNQTFVQILNGLYNLRVRRVHAEQTY